MLTELIIGILGWASGMLVNYLADVLPYYRRLAVPACLHCGERFPLVNYLLWPRECPTCTGRRSPRVWFVEVLMTAAALFIWFYPPEGFGFAGGLAVLIYLGIVAVIDIEHKLILHPVSLAGAVLGLSLGTIRNGLLLTVAGGAVGYLLMLGFYYLGVAFTKYMQKRRGGLVEDALGFGDVNLAGVLGLLMGLADVLNGLFFGLFAAALFSIVYMLVMLARKQYSFLTAIPYGPFLILGAVRILFFPN